LIVFLTSPSENLFDFLRFSIFMGPSSSASMLWSQFYAIFGKKMAFFSKTNVMINFFGII
jgi:hypothetical protein